jgi:hypothetical protein
MYVGGGEGWGSESNERLIGGGRGNECSCCEGEVVECVGYSVDRWGREQTFRGGTPPVGSSARGSGRAGLFKRTGLCKRPVLCGCSVLDALTVPAISPE